MHGEQFVVGGTHESMHLACVCNIMEQFITFTTTARLNSMSLVVAYEKEL